MSLPSNVWNLEFQVWNDDDNCWKSKWHGLVGEANIKLKNGVVHILDEIVIGENYY